MSRRMTGRWRKNVVSVVGTRLPRAASRFYPDVLWRMPAKPKTAYLTFDDGPNPECTERILSVLAGHRAKATFFLLGAQAERHADLVRSLQSAGHGIGNHSYSHPDAWKTEASEVLSELETTTTVLEDLTGESVRVMRPPYGRFTRSMRAWCRRHGQQMTMWDVGPGDYLEAMSTEAVVHQVRTHLRPGSIVVLHDNPRCALKTPVALDRLLERLTDEGWSFPSLTTDR